MSFEDKILAQYKVKVIKNEPDGMTSLCGDKMQIEDGKHFFEIPAGMAQYYKEMFPGWTVSDPYIPKEDQPERYAAEEKEFVYKYACTLCDFKCNSASVLEIHPCANAKTKPAEGPPISARALEKNRRIDAMIERDKADALKEEKKDDARFGKRNKAVDEPAETHKTELEQVSL